MSLVSLLFGFQGRINRAQYWLTGLVIGALIALIVIGLFLNVGLAATQSREALAAALFGGGIALLPVIAILAWCNTALQVKRLHDRGQSGYWVLLQFAPSAAIFMSLGLLTPIAMPVSFLIGLGFLINLGFLPGVEGPNQYGGPPGSAPPIPSHKGGAPEAPRPAGALVSAQSAIDRAIAEKARQAQPAKAPVRTGARTPAPLHAQPSFGRRVTR